MKRLFVLAGLLAALGGPGLAQQPKEQPKIKTIFDYKQELSLSDEQISTMKGFLSELNNSVKASREQLTKLETEYRGLISKESTTTAQAKAKLQEIADATITMRLKDLDISRKITATMSAEQREKWKGIQAKVRSEQPK